MFLKSGEKELFAVQCTQKNSENFCSAGCLFCRLPLVSSGSEQDSSSVRITHEIDEVEVAASRSPLIYSQIARILSVIESADIQQSPAQSVQDLLEFIAGVDVRQRGAEGVQADISIRGGSFDQTLILLNGINITDPQTGIII